MVDDKKAKAKKMITTAEAKTDNRSASEKGADRIEEMVKNLTSDQTKSLILALKTRREDLTGKSEGSVGRRLREMAKGKNHVVITHSDITRATPNDRILPIILQEIEKRHPWRALIRINYSQINLLVKIRC